MEINIGALVVEEDIILGSLQLDVVKLTPELENLEVTPSTEEQNFKSAKYGYDNVTVKAIETETIEIMPSAEEQIETGLFGEVTVAGDENLVPENIKKDVEIFGVVGNAKTSNVKITDASYLFSAGARTDYLYELLSVCESVSDTSYMFYNCRELTEIDLTGFDTSNSTNMSNMFNDCNALQSLDVSRFDTSKVKNMSYMFYSCRTIEKLDVSGFNTSNVTTMRSMFYYCQKVNSLDVSNFNTSNVTSMYSMFYGCFAVTDLDLSGFDASKVNEIQDVFRFCNNLTNLKSFTNLGKAYTQKSRNYGYYKLDLSYSSLLTHESLMSVINNLYDLNLTYNVANGGTLYTQQLVLGSTNMAKLTADEIAIATNKGWTVS